MESRNHGRSMKMNKWISVKERLPELKIKKRFGDYLVSEPVYITYKHNGKNYVCPIPCIFHSNGNWYNDADALEEWVCLDDYDDKTDAPIMAEVIAWMPMMEPYDKNSADNKVEQLKNEIKDWTVFNASVKNGEYVEEHVNVVSYENVLDIIDKTLV